MNFYCDCPSLLNHKFKVGLTGVEDGSVDPALGVAHRHLAAGVGEQNVCAACPGGGCHSVGVVAAPVPHQHAVIITGIQLISTKSHNSVFLYSIQVFFI